MLNLFRFFFYIFIINRIYGRQLFVIYWIVNEKW